MKHGIGISSAALALGLLGTPGCGEAKDGPRSDASTPAEAKSVETKSDQPKSSELAAEPTKGSEGKGPAAEPTKGSEGKGSEVAAEAFEPPTIGVAECDDYIAKMNACFAGDVIPAELRQTQKQAFEASAKGWAATVAANPDSTDVLVVGCKAALDMAKMAYPRCFGG